ncbi:MAG: SHOCT domain-containing protein [Saprospiraceae bacterium]|nr:SHOCT domain-containing protein [Saprospiraceae bacterium]
MVFLNARFPVMFMIGLLEGLGLLMMSDNEFNRRYNGGTAPQEGQFPWQRQQQQGRQFPWQQPNPARTQSAPQNRTWKNVEVPDYSNSRRNIFKESALRKYKEFDLDGAIEDFQKSLQQEPRDIATHFNIACAYSLTEQGEKAYTHLSKAVEAGFTDFEKINSHDDLAYVRIQPQWDAFKDSGYRRFEPFKKDPFETPKPEPQNDLLLDQLNKLNELRQKGLISDAEYALEKRRLNE